MILIYLILLIIAPQLWIEPFVDMRVDMFIYPFWMLIILIKGRLNEFFEFNKQDLFFFGMILWIILSALANPRTDMTNQLITEYIKMFVLYRLVILSIDSDDDFKAVIKYIIVLTYIIVIEALQHKYSPDGIGWAGQTLGWVDQSVLDAGGTGRTRWINIFDGPGVFCVLFTIALPFVLRFLDKHYSFFIKIMAIILLIPLLWAIWTTGSRGGFLATLSIFAVYGLIKMQVSFMTMMKVGGFLVIAYMLAPSHLTSIRDDNKSAQHRVDMWIEGIEMIEQNPLFGIGKGNFAPYTGKLIAHNSAIEIMGETGGPGFFLWIGILYLAFKSIYLLHKSTDDKRYISLLNALTITFIGYIVSSMFVTLEYETLYFLLALPRALIQNKKIDIDFNRKDFYNIAGMMFGFYITLKAFVIMYY